MSTPTELVGIINSYSQPPTQSVWFGYRSRDYDSINSGWYVYTTLKFAIEQFVSCCNPKKKSGEIAIITHRSPPSSESDSERWGSWMTIDNLIEVNVICRKNKNEVCVVSEYKDEILPIIQRSFDYQLTIKTRDEPW